MIANDSLDVRVFTWENLWPFFCEEFGVSMPELDPETHGPLHPISVQKEMTGLVLPTPATSTTLDIDLSQVKESDAVGTANHVDTTAWKEICAAHPNMDPDAINWATWWLVSTFLFNPLALSLTGLTLVN
jgi:hypothetical protein